MNFEDLTAKHCGNMKEKENVRFLFNFKSYHAFFKLLNIINFLVLFNIIKFPNDPCKASENEEGICYTHSQCDERGGVQMAPCAAGFGICCLCGFKFEIK